MTHIHDQIDYAVGALIVHNQKVLLVHHRELKIWLPPGGHVELDEDPEEALLREVAEETGLKIELIGDKPDISDPDTKILHVPAFMDIHRINDSHRHVGMVYLARSDSDQVKLAEKEHFEIRWFNEDELDQPEYNLKNTIRFYAKEALRRAVS